MTNRDLPTRKRREKHRLLGPDDSTASDTDSSSCSSTASEEELNDAQAPPAKRLKTSDGGTGFVPGLKNRRSRERKKDSTQKDAYIFYRVKHDEFKELTERYIKENPGFRRVLDNYFRDLGAIATIRTNEGAVMEDTGKASREEVDKMLRDCKKDAHEHLKDIRSSLRGSLDQLDMMLGLDEAGAQVAIGFEKFTDANRANAQRAKRWGR